MSMHGEYVEHAVEPTFTATVYEQANQETDETRDLMQLFSLDLGHLPCLEREEEYSLACQARDAWQSVLERLREQHSLVTALLTENKGALAAYDSLSEPDVLSLLDYVEDWLRQPEPEEAQGPMRQILQIWLCRMRAELARFRTHRDELVRRNLRLVLKLARRPQGCSLGPLDLVQEGVFGLMRAIEKFDPDRGVKFVTYAVWWIRQAITRALEQGSGVVRTSTYFQERRSRFLRLAQTLETTLQYTPSAAELLEMSDNRSEVAALVTTPVTIVSLDAPLSSDEEGSLVEMLPHPDGSSPEEELLKADRSKMLHQALTSLVPQDAEVLRLRFGLADGHSCTLEEVGQRLRMSREQVRQRERRALISLRKYFYGDVSLQNLRRKVA
jgi:RNA polymerase sigma factor (sigma-70 family)